MLNRDGKFRFNKRYLVLLATGILLGVLFSTIYVEATAPLSTPVISGGPYPGAPTWTIFTEAGTCYAKDANGAVAASFTSTNASSTGNLAEDTLTSGGTITFSDGTFNLDAPIIVDHNNVKIVLSAGTVLYSTNTVNSFPLNEGGSPGVMYDSIVVTHANYFSLSGGKFDGYGGNDYYYGIMLQHTFGANIKDVTFTRARVGGGVYFDSENTWFTVTDSIFINGMAGTAYTANSGFDSFNNTEAFGTFSNLKVYGQSYTRYGICESSSSKISVTSPMIQGVIDAGVFLDYNTAAISANRQPKDSEVIGGVIDTVLTYNGVQITNGTGNLVQGVRIKGLSGASQYPILMTGSLATGNRIFQNDVSGNYNVNNVYAIYCANGAYTNEIRGNIGFTTEASGIAYGMTYGGSINFTLAYTPTYETMTISTDGSNPYQVDTAMAGKDSTHFVVGFYNRTDCSVLSGPYTVDWSVQWIPNP
jgi:hypothetical protein